MSLSWSHNLGHVSDKLIQVDSYCFYVFFIDLFLISSFNIEFIGN